MEELEEIKNGCLWDGATDKDRIISGEMLAKLPELIEQDQVIFEYNQGNSNDCTIYSALGALSDLFNREITEEQIEETNEESRKRGRVKGNWRYTQSAVDLACDMREKRYPDEKVAYYRIDNFDDESIDKVIDKNYSLCTSFNGSSEYQRDRKDNGQIDNAKQGTTTYGHAVCLIKREGKKFVKDNYKGRKENWRYTNIYWIIPKISDLRRNNVRQGFSYVIVKVKSDKEKDIERLNKMKNLIDGMIRDNSEMRENTNEKTYKELLHKMNEANRKKKADIERELSKYFL